MSVGERVRGEYVRVLALEWGEWVSKNISTCSVLHGVGVQEDFYLRNYDVGSCASNCAIMPSNINQRRHHQTITDQGTIAIWTTLVEPM